MFVGLKAKSRAASVPVAQEWAGAGVHVELSRGCENLKTVASSEIAPRSDNGEKKVLGGNVTSLFVYALQHNGVEALKART